MGPERPTVHLQSSSPAQWGSSGSHVPHPTRKAQEVALCLLLVLSRHLPPYRLKSWEPRCSPTLSTCPDLAPPSRRPL